MGVAKPFYFVLQPSYWFPLRTAIANAQKEKENIVVDLQGDAIEDGSANASIPAENVNESLVGPPTVTVNQLNKTYGSSTVVKDLSFKMYENQIFALLGHNGAGKVTTN